jgi:hypothetical protein
MSKLQEHLPDSLRDVEDRLACINSDLERMPQFKRGTPWHLDRVREKQALLLSVDRLRTQLRLYAERN